MADPEQQSRRRRECTTDPSPRMISRTVLIRMILSVEVARTVHHEGERS